MKRKTTNTIVFVIQGLILSLALGALSSAQAAWIEDEIAANLIKVTASSQYGDGQAVRHLVDGSGLRDGLHDNDGSAQTMWHTAQTPPSTSPAAGLPASPAWVRFDFAQPQKFNWISLWNHNQANLTDRGFRMTRIFGSADGTTWFALTAPEVVELSRASGSPGLEAVLVTNTADARELQSVIIAAEAKDGNYGSDYFGLSAVRFVRAHEVAEQDLPVPTAMSCAALPYAPYRRLAQGREALRFPDHRCRVWRRS
jgi:hypothetical protein